MNQYLVVGTFGCKASKSKVLLLFKEIYASCIFWNVLAFTQLGTLNEGEI